MDIIYTQDISCIHIRLMLMDIKTYTQLNIHTRHILHSYKAYVDGYKNLHTTKYTHNKTYTQLYKAYIHTRHILHSYKAHVDGYKNLHTTKYTHKTYLAFI